MTELLRQPELQLRALRLYGELLCRRGDWAGQLVLAAFAGASSSGLAAAASLAGAASLTVDADAAAVKKHFRDGAFDFVVNTLDEALRAIKNEVRKGRPIAIGLIAEPEVVLREAGARGLAAVLVVSGVEEPSELERGVGEVGAFYVHGGSDSDDLREWLRRRHWVVGEAPAQVWQGFVHDSVCSRWLRELTKYQRSVGTGARWVWLSDEERRRG